MKVAHVHSSPGFSGGELQLFMLLDELRRLGTDVTLFAQQGSWSLQHAHERDIPSSPLAPRNAADLLNMWRLRCALRSGRFDLAHLHSGHAIWLGSMAAHPLGIPVVATKRMDRRIRPGLKSYLIWHRWVDAAVAISPAVLSQIRDFGVPIEKSHLICSVPDLSRTAASTPVSVVRTSFACPDSTVVLLALGSLHRRKGIDTLLSSLKLLLNEKSVFRCWIVGDGPERDSLRKMSRNLGLDAVVQFIGHRTDTADILNAADILVMPSRAEGMGNAALEAMACGKPVVAGAVGGLTYSIVNDETGLLVQPDHPPALAKAIRSLIEDPLRRTAMGNAGRARIAREFTLERMAAHYQSLYRRLAVCRTTLLA